MPSGSLLFDESKVQSSPAQLALNAATGSWFGTVTVMSWLKVAVSPRSSVTVRVTV